MSRIVLASASPRRAELLDQIGVDYVTLPASIDEGAVSGSTITERIAKVARAKAEAGATLAKARDLALPVLGADTVVVCDEVELGKPSSPKDARQMLARLSGRDHWVYTAVVLITDTGVDEMLGETRVWFKNLSEDEIDQYLASGEPFDKAGAYGIQGRGGLFVTRIEGSYSNVVGLPLFETGLLLARVDTHT